jgi:Xaa-Pro aminopeptidase
MSNKITKSFFTSNRNQLIEQLPAKSVVLVSANDYMPKSADQTFPFYQNSDFFFLTGLNQEKTILCLNNVHPDPEMRQVLFLLNASPEMEIWTGHRYTLEEARKISGIQTVFQLDDFDVLIKEFLLLAQNVFMLQNEAPKFITEFPTANDILIQKTKAKYPLHNYQRVAPLLNNMRLVKKKEELEMMKKAISITESALKRILKTIRADMYEYQVAADISHEFMWNGASGHAFEPIVASGRNACVLHYTTPNDKLIKNDLLLLDFGAEYEHYSSDCSRTIPIGGKFSKRQKQCYEAVLRVFKKAISLYVPGNTINGINNQVNVWMEQEMVELGLFSKDDLKKQNPSSPLFKKYFMHGTAHFVGLDVHDVGMKHIPFEKGMVLTCEPGLYIAQENIGIRIENMVMVDKSPIDLMKNFPIEVKDIESAMKK